MRMPLTERQNEAFEYIRRCIHDLRTPPTIKEIGHELGIRSSNAVVKLLRALEKKGYVEREPRKARGLRIVDAQDPFALDEGPPTLPVVSRTSSRNPDTLRMRPAAWLTVDPLFLHGATPDRCVIGRSADDGMFEEGIRKGDFLVIEEVPVQELANGTLAACLVREELRARRFHRQLHTIRLRATNRRYSEDSFSLRDPGCFVVGRVLGVLRRL